MDGIWIANGIQISFLYLQWSNFRTICKTNTNANILKHPTYCCYIHGRHVCEAYERMTQEWTVETNHLFHQSKEKPFCWNPSNCEAFRDWDAKMVNWCQYW
jgi:hypothetical protein